MSPNGSGVGTGPLRITNYIESRVAANTQEHAYGLDSAELPEFRTNQIAAHLDQWYLGELFDLCSSSGVQLARCSTITGQLHLCRIGQEELATTELRSTLPHGGYTGVHQLRLSGDMHWPLLSIETSGKREFVATTNADFFDLSHGRVDAAQRFSLLNIAALSGGEVARILKGLDPELLNGELPSSLRIIGIAHNPNSRSADLISFEWRSEESQVQIESMLLSGSDGQLRRRGGSLQIDEIPPGDAERLVASIVETVLSRDLDRILALPLELPRKELSRFASLTRRIAEYPPMLP